MSAVLTKLVKRLESLPQKDVQAIAESVFAVTEPAPRLTLSDEQVAEVKRRRAEKKRKWLSTNALRKHFSLREI